MSFSTCLSLQVLSQKACWCNIRFSNTAERLPYVSCRSIFIQAPGWLCGLVSISVNLPLIHLLLLLFQPLNICEALYKNMLRLRSVLCPHRPKFFTVHRRNVFKVNSGSLSTVIQCQQDQGPRMQQGFVAVKLSES